MECPVLHPFELRYIRAFWALDTERYSNGQIVGKIPWSKCMQYGREMLGFDPEMLEAFWTIISAMDRGYHAWQKGEHDRYVRLQKSEAPKSPSKKSNRKRSKR